jgi:hypothetical protein
VVMNMGRGACTASPTGSILGDSAKVSILYFSYKRDITGGIVSCIPKQTYW